MNNRSKTFLGIGKQTIVTVAMGVMGILYFSIMSRLLTPDDFGYFAIITAVTAILTSLTEAGLGAAVIQRKDASKDYISTAFTISLLLGVIFVSILFFASNFISRLMVDSDILTNGYRIMSMSLIFYSTNSVCRAIIIKQLDFLKYGIYDIVAYLLSSLVGIYLAYTGHGFYSTVIAMLLHQFFICLQIHTLGHIKIKLQLKKEHISSIVSFSGWLTASVIIRNITQQVDKLITSRWLPVSVLGEYNRPSGFITQITGQTNSIFDTILFPILSNINDNISQIRSSFEKTTSLIFLYSVVLTGSFILGSDLLIKIFLGSKWLYLNNLFCIISISIIFLSYSRLTDCYFRSLGIVKSYFIIRCVSCVSTLLCVFIGCHFGLYGLAYGVVISRIFDCIFKSTMLKRHTDINRLDLIKTIIKSLILPLLFFAISICVKTFIEGIVGSVLSLILFLLLLVAICVFFPEKMGKIYYENLYCVVKKKIFKE